MPVDIILGLQWGDEGKGKIVDVLSKQYKIIARFQGGPNAGHTLEFDGIKHVLHTIPSGIFHNSIINLIGNGVVIDPVILEKEIKSLYKYNINFSKSLFISRKAHLILPTHRILDAASEASKGNKKIGSTLKGIGPTYMDKTGRNGIRVGDVEKSNWINKYNQLKEKHLKLLNFYEVKVEFDLKKFEKEFFQAIDLIKEMNIIDSEVFLHNEIKSNVNILAEGAQGSLLDIDFGSYPYVTSSNTTAAGACTGLGIPPNQLNNIIGIFKAYSTRVGSGPFPTELSNSIGKKIAKIGNEFGSTTGRSRRCGWLDLVSLKYAVRINGITKLVMMKSDVLSGIEKIKICVGYEMDGKKIDYFPYSIEKHSVIPIYKELKGWFEDLTKIENENEFPVNFKNYISYIEKELNIPISIISVGPNRKQTIFRNL